MKAWLKVAASVVIGIIVGCLGTYYVLAFFAKQRATAIHLNGREEFEKKHFFKASEYFNIAIGLDPNNYEPYIYLAKFYTMKGMYDLAEEKYEIALALLEYSDYVPAGEREYISKELKLLRDGERRNKEK